MGDARVRPIGWLRTSALAAAALAVSGAAAVAADMPGDYLPPPPPETPAVRGVEVASGIYLRGDIGYRFQRIGTASSNDPTQVPNISSAKIDDAFIGGLGAGYKLDWFRVDVTGDYGSLSKFSATTTSGSELTAKIDDFTAMVNAYVDLGHWSGFTPYIGGGVGLAYITFSNYSDPSSAAPMPPAVHRWNTAWAAMAGVSYQFTPELMMDVGYRHVDLGKVDGGPGGQLNIKHLSGDEVRIGFRYLLY